MFPLRRAPLRTVPLRYSLGGWPTPHGGLAYSFRLVLLRFGSCRFVAFRFVLFRFVRFVLFVSLVVGRVWCGIAPKRPA